MIYTITFNPSLDYCIVVKDFKTGTINRTVREQIYPGGKGINVSIVLKNLGMPSTTLGFLGGFTGDEIERRLKEQKIRTDFIRVPEGMSRINVKMRSGVETEINGSGPVIGTDELRRLYEKLALLKEGDTLVLAGSIPAGMPENVYQEILRTLEGKKIRTVVDATGALLRNVLSYHPFLVKPNHHELGALFDVKIDTKKDAAVYGEKLQQAGARNVLVSMGAKGAVLLTEDGQILEKDAPGGTLVNSVGAGDSMVAGFLAGYEKYKDYEKALWYGLCAGSASACGEGLATGAQVEKMLAEKI